MFVCLLVESVNAGVVTNISSGYTTHDFVSSGLTAGPITESGITYTSTYSFSAYGYEGRYGFADNGAWTNMDMIGLNTSFGAITIEFDDEVKEVLAFVNYIDTIEGSAKMRIFDSSFNLLETFALTFSTGGGDNTGFDLGFSRNIADIKYIQFIEQGIGANNLRSFGIAQAPEPSVPEPSALALFGLGLAGIGFLRKKKIT